MVFQGVEVMAEPWGITPALQRAIHILLLVGLCVTLVLAWHHGERGSQRASGPELLMIALLLFIAGGMIAMLRGEEEVSEPTEAVPVATLDPDRPSVAVLPFTDMSAEGDQQYFGDGIAEEIAEAIAGALEVELGLQPKGAHARGLTDDLDAYQLYLLGRDRWVTRSPTNLREAIQYFERAIERDSTFALAYSGLADAYNVLPYYDLTVESLDACKTAKAAATRALELNPNIGEVHSTLGWLGWGYDWDWEASERHFLKALELAPNYAPAHHWYGNLRGTFGELDWAARELEIALSLDPLSNIVVFATGQVLSFAGRTEEARTHFERAVQMEPPVPWTMWHYAEDLIRIEPVNTTRAAELFGEFTTFFGYPDPDRAKSAFLGRGEGTIGVAEYSAFLDDLIERTVLRRSDIMYLYIPLLTDEFYEVLEDATEVRYFQVPFVPLYVATYFPEVMEDPRWQAFLDRIGNPGSGG